MKLVKPGFQILTVDGKPLTRAKGKQMIKFLELVARTCYKSEDKIGPGTAETLITNIIKRGHEAMLEFADIVVKFTVDRGVSHEIVRHRIASYAQESTRYCNYGKQGAVAFIIPSWFQLPDGIWTLDDVRHLQEEERCPSQRTINWLRHMLVCEEAYLTDIKLGGSPQEARANLPNSLKTEIVSKFNIREWRQIFRLRTAAAAHPQMQEVMRPLLAKLRKIVPIVFDDVGLV
jgi:thymidylate synthase (FAD)